MIFTKTSIDGVYIIDLERKKDERGYLARICGQKDFADNDIDFTVMQGYITHSNTKGTLRGFHFLRVPEKKLTRVTKGSVYEVIIDIRAYSKTFKQWEAFTLRDTDFKMLYMGPGIAHAILTLEDNTELMSLYSPEYNPGNERGIRYDDPSFVIHWPTDVVHVSQKDTAWENFPTTPASSRTRRDK